MNKNKSDILLETGTNELEIAEFGIYMNNSSLKMQSFGINVAKIREIIKTPSFIVVPDTDKNIIGIFKLRDKVIPLIDLANWLNEKTDDIDLKKCYVIVAEFNKNNFGFLVHDIKTIHRMSWQKIISPKNVTNTNVNVDCITGIVNFDDRIMMMIDFERIVAEINPKLSMGKDISEKDLKSAQQKQGKVIIAEDSSLVRDIIRKILSSGGFEIDEFVNGKEAYEHLKSLKEKSISEDKNINEYVNLLVTDIEMPQMDGHSLCKNVKEDPVLKEIPVILYSSLIYEEMRKKGESVGADAQLSKPELSTLLKKVTELIKK